MNQGHVAFGEIVNLELLRDDLDVEYSHALIRSKDMEVIRMALPAGKKMPEHSVKGQVTVQCLKGKVQFETDEKKQVLEKDDWIALERGAPHALEVEEDAVLLLTILFPDKSS